MSLDIWEEFDAANDPVRKQNFYNQFISKADIFVVAYHGELIYSKNPVKLPLNKNKNMKTILPAQSSCGIPRNLYAKKCPMRWISDSNWSQWKGGWGNWKKTPIILIFHQNNKKKTGQTKGFTAIRPVIPMTLNFTHHTSYPVYVALVKLFRLVYRTSLKALSKSGLILFTALARMDIPVKLPSARFRRRTIQALHLPTVVSSTEQ